MYSQYNACDFLFGTKACLLKEIQEVRKQAYLKELEHSQREVELVKKYQG